MLRTIYLITIFFLLFNSANSQTDRLFIATSKQSFQLFTPIEVELKTLRFSNCNNILSCTMEVFDSNLRIVYSSKYALNREPEIFRFSMPDTCGKGNYLLNAYISNLDSNLEDHISSALIYYGNYQESQFLAQKKCFIKVMPESSKALYNFTNRFIVQISSKDSIPIMRDFFVRNQNGLLVAKGKTNFSGITVVDIPNIEGDRYSITAFNCDTIQLSGFEYDGFAIQATGKEKLQIALLKGEKEQLQQVKLMVYKDSLLISETPIHFQNDIAIIETLIDVAPLANQLVLMKLVDLNNNLLCTQSYWLTEHPEPAALIIKNFDSEKVGNNVLNVPTNSFSLYFQTSIPSGEKISYQLLNEKAEIITIGQSIVNNSGHVEIANCNFYGNATASFFINPKYKNPILTFVNKSPIHNNLFSKARKYFPINNIPSNTPLVNYTFKNDTLTNHSPLPEVVVKTFSKTRIQEMEEKYITSALFKSIMSTDIVVEDDPSAINYNNRFFDYLVKYIPGLKWDNGKQSFSYRNGSVDIFVDETINKPVPESMLDIAYIKFIKGSFRGSNQSRNAGPLTVGSGYNVGVTGYISIYTKKFDANNSKSIKLNVAVEGFKN
ncbi:MAG: hypothetical protein Q8K64_07295 [Sediminibacterium sp.]|nr:hypothetical protein [Sediminibacterium sp.]